MANYNFGAGESSYKEFYERSIQCHCLVGSRSSKLVIHREHIFSESFDCVICMVSIISIIPYCGRLWSNQTRARESTANLGLEIVARVFVGLVQPRTAQGGRKTAMVGRRSKDAHRTILTHKSD